MYKRQFVPFAVEGILFVVTVIAMCTIFKLFVATLMTVLKFFSAMITRFDSTCAIKKEEEPSSSEH